MQVQRTNSERQRARRIVNQRFLTAMLEMGIPLEKAELALSETGSVGIEVRPAHRPRDALCACVLRDSKGVHTGPLQPGFRPCICSFHQRVQGCLDFLLLALTMVMLLERYWRYLLVCSVHRGASAGGNRVAL